MSLLKDMREASELALEYGITTEEAFEMMYGEAEHCGCEDYPCCGH